MLLAGFFSELSDAFGSVGRFIGDGGPFMYCLLALSLLSVGVIAYKGLSLRFSGVIPPVAEEAMSHAEEYVRSGQPGRLAEALRAAPSPLARVGLCAMDSQHADQSAATQAAEANAREEVVEMERGIALMEVVITIAPLLGLLGTVSGLVGVFGNLSAAGTAGEHAEVAKGIAEALNTTIAGLAVAVPTVIAHSYFTRKIERIGVRMEVLTGRLVGAVHGGSAR